MSWRDEILKHFVEPLPRVLVVSDPDQLLLEPQVFEQLSARKLEFVEYKDPIRFWNEFETCFREGLKKGLLRLVVRVADESVQDVPYKILKQGDVVELRLADLFPKFSLSVIKELTFEQLDALHAVSGQHQGSASFMDTCDFLLRKLFKGSGYEEVRTKEQLMEFLFRTHYEEIVYPPSLVDFLVRRFEEFPDLQKLPLKELIGSASFFYQFVQREWEQFVRSASARPDAIMETAAHDPYRYFWLPNVRAILDNLFLEGKLSCVTGASARLFPKWMQVGIQQESEPDYKEQMDHFEEKLAELLKEPQSYKNWMRIAQTFGEWKYRFLAMGGSTHLERNGRMKELEDRIEQQFEAWILNHFTGLIQYPDLVMVHHIPEYLRTRKQKQKVALIVMDGMSFVQWAQIKQNLMEMFQLEERSVFAWVPTLTSVSRQALFAGELPYYFGDSIHTTQKEESRWKNYWENQGIPKLRISFEKGLGQGKYDPDQIAALQKPQIQVAGLVVDMVDKLMHRAIQGLAGIHEEIELWLRNGYLQGLLTDLLTAGFDVYLTSDHGNKESIGIGKISEGVLVETGGERARIYKENIFRDQAAYNYSSIPWNDTALPDGYHVLLAKANQAFIIESQVAVSHGGISLEEVIVPFVRVARKSDGQ